LIFAAISDLHIKPDLKIWHTQQAKNDFILSCKQLEKIIAENNISTLLIAGDIFDSPKISSDCLYNIYKHLFRPVRNLGCDIYYISGQHDNVSPPWLSVFPDINYVNEKRFKIGSWTAYGLDYKSEPREIITNLHDPILLTHQVWSDFIPQGLCSSSDIPEDVKLVLSGDFHQFKIIELYNNRKLVSIGPFCHSSSHASRLIDSGMVLVDDNLNVEYIKFLQRPIYRFSGSENIEEIYNFVLEDSREIRRKILEFEIPDVDIPVIVLETNSEEAEGFKKKFENFNGVYWKLLPKVEKRNGYRPAHEELIDSVDFMDWVKTEFELLYPEYPQLTSRLITLFKEPSVIERWKEFFKAFEDVIYPRIVKAREDEANKNRSGGN